MRVRFYSFSAPVTNFLNIFTWLCIHLLVAGVAILLPTSLFDPRKKPFQTAPWEQMGSVYERYLKIKRWKGILPDGALLFAGFSKGHIRSRNPDYLERYVRETCRGELAHWSVMLFSPLFFLWNPLWARYTMIIYGILANVPFILVQRYNRAHLLRILHRLDMRQ